MKHTQTAWIVYISLRLLFFAVPLVILYALDFAPWVAVLLAALIGVSLSIIFLSKQRWAASESIYEWRTRERTEDDVVEDAAFDSADTADQPGAVPGETVPGDAAAPYDPDLQTGSDPKVTPRPTAENA